MVKMRWAELSKLEFLIKFHQFDNRRKFIVVVANNVKCRCHRHRHHRHSCRWKTMYTEFHCVLIPPPLQRKKISPKMHSNEYGCKSVEYVFHSQNHQFTQLSSKFLNVNWVELKWWQHKINCTEIFGHKNIILKWFILYFEAIDQYEFQCTNV